MVKLTEIVTGALIPLVPLSAGSEMAFAYVDRYRLNLTQAVVEKNPQIFHNIKRSFGYGAIKTSLIAGAIEALSTPHIIDYLRDFKITEKELIPFLMLYAARTIAYNLEASSRRKIGKSLAELTTPEVKEREKLYNSYWRQRA